MYRCHMYVAVFCTVAAMPASLTRISAPPRRNLARIAPPAAGFQRGARYTIALTTEVNRFKYRTRTSFVIDDQPLAPQVARLIVDGAPATRLLATVDAAPDPGLEATAAVDFHYALPDAYEPYRQAVMYWSETRTGSAPFAPTGNLKSYCGNFAFGETWLGDGRDVVRTSCRAAGAPVDVRGRVGLLEVEDQLQETNTEQVAFRHAANQSCNGGARSARRKRSRLAATALRRRPARIGPSWRQRYRHWRQ